MTTLLTITVELDHTTELPQVKVLFDGPALPAEELHEVMSMVKASAEQQIELIEKDHPELVVIIDKPQDDDLPH